MRSARNGFVTTQSTRASFCSSEPTASPHPVITAIGIRLVALTDGMSELPPAHPRHANISEDAVKSLRCKEVKRFATARRQINSETFALKQIAK